MDDITLAEQGRRARRLLEAMCLYSMGGYDIGYDDGVEYGA
jgi:hypothetical protein